MSTSSATKSDSYDPWLDSTDDVKDLWQTCEGNTIAVTETSMYLPSGIGPLEGAQKLDFDDFDDVNIEVTHSNNTRRIAFPFGIAGILILIGFLIGDGMGMVFLVSGVLASLAGCVGVVKERNDVTTYTELTLHMGRFSKQYEFPGNYENEFEELVEGNIKS